MKMVAAAKLRRAQMAAVGSRPYAQTLSEILFGLVSEDFVHPLFEKNENPSKALVLIYTTNRGLCGGFNSNLLRRTETFARESLASVGHIDIDVIGKKGRDFYKAKNKAVKNVFLEYADKLSFEEAKKMALEMIESFQNKNYDAVYLAYNQFKSALTQETTITQVLPISIQQNELQAASLIEPIYEPNKTEMLEGLIPKYLATQIYQAHLESVASELGARMTAMENATNNARDMIGLLTLEYNRARQAAITKELMDIVNGAESIK